MRGRTSFVILILLGTSVGACGGKGGGTTAGPGPGVAAQPASPPADPASETLGGVGLGMNDREVEAALGAPAAKGEVEVWEATGDSVSTWTWPATGVSLDMSQREDGFTVISMTIEAPSTLTTSRGIGIGATFEEVDRAYGEFRGKGPEEGEPEVWGPGQVIVGSVYGGTFFNFEDGKVTSIFVGAGAE